MCWLLFSIGEELVNDLGIVESVKICLEIADKVKETGVLAG